MEFVRKAISQTWQSCLCRRTFCPLKTFGHMASRTTQHVEVQKCWQVSSYGRVCNTRGEVSRGSLKPSGYCTVKISCSDFYVHRLVALAFLGPPPDQLTWQVHHRDGNPSNNRLDNLEYVTQSQNILASFASHSRRCGGTMTSMPVMWRAVGSQSWSTSPSMTQTAAELSMSKSSVWHGCHRGKSVKGYEFQLADCGEIETLEGEEWQQMYDPMSGLKVPGRMVSSLGRIKSKNGKISWGCLEKTGYYRTGMCLTSHRRTEYVHRLVAFAFVGPPVSRQCGYVNHKDLDKGNNAVENLEYVTQSRNMTHFHATKSISSSFNCKPVDSRLKNSKEWTPHTSVTRAASSLGIGRWSISRCLSACNSQTSACGYEFRLANAPSREILPDEEWRRVDVARLLREREKCARRGARYRRLWFY